VPAQVHRHDAVTAIRKVLELGHEVRVIAAPPVDQQNGRLSSTRLFVK
jgi:hypothetical protein